MMFVCSLIFVPIITETGIRYCLRASPAWCTAPRLTGLIGRNNATTGAQNIYHIMTVFDSVSITLILRDEELDCELFFKIFSSSNLLPAGSN